MAKLPDKVGNASPPSDQDALRQELERQLGPILQGGQRQQVLTRIISIVESEQFSGPIAHPRHLREYEEILPGSAERIVAMAESALDHNQTMQRTAINSDVSDTKQGRWLGFAALVLLIAAASFAGARGNNTLAIAFLSAGALGVISQFIRGRSNGK